MSELSNLLKLLNAVKKSPICECNQKSTSEVILWLMSVLNAFQRVDIGFGRNSEFLREISSDMTRMDLMQIAKEEKYNVHIRPLHALGLIYTEYMGNVPQEILLDILESGKDREATRMAVIIAIEPLLDVLTQMLKRDDGDIVLDTTNTVDCGVMQVTMICSKPCARFGHCAEFRIARAILESPIMSRYLAKNELMEVHDLQKEVDRAVEICGVPQRSIMLHPKKNFGKLKSIAKGRKKNSCDKPSDAVYAIQDALYENPNGAFEALLDIISTGDDEPAVMLAVKALRDITKEGGSSAVSISALREIADFLEDLQNRPVEPGIEVVVLDTEKFLESRE